MGLEKLPEKIVEKDIPLLEAKATTNNNNGGADENKVCDEHQFFMKKIMKMMMVMIMMLMMMMMMISLRWRANVWCWLGQRALGKPLVSIFTLGR